MLRSLLRLAPLSLLVLPKRISPADAGGGMPIAGIAVGWNMHGGGARPAARPDFGQSDGHGASPVP